MRTAKRISTVLLLLIFLTACGGKTTADPQSPTSDAEPEAESVLTLPYELADGKLVVQSLFPSGIENPDCGYAAGDNIATLELVNASEEFLENAQITVTMKDGTQIPFSVTDLPAGRTVWAFAADNTEIGMETSCVSISCNPLFTADDPLMTGVILCETNDAEITVRNLSDHDLTNLLIGCHCLFDDIYFGGLTYMYPVDNLPAGSSATVYAEDCFLGAAEVVRIMNQ